MGADATLWAGGPHCDKRQNVVFGRKSHICAHAPNSLKQD